MAQHDMQISLLFIVAFVDSKFKYVFISVQANNTLFMHIFTRMAAAEMPHSLHETLNLIRGG